MNTGTLFIISAPSGAGKTSLVKQLTATRAQLKVSISHTTRPQRKGETDGDDYFFVSFEEFQKMLTAQEFLEYAQVFDNYYATAQRTVEKYLNQGIDLILEIDWQGAQQVRKKLPDSISIFILPPSTEELQQRLQSRGQDSNEIILRRMQDAVTEISHYDEYDFLVVNDDFNQALNELNSIVTATRLKKNRRKRELVSLLDDLMGS